MDKFLDPIYKLLGAIAFAFSIIEWVAGVSKANVGIGLGVAIFLVLMSIHAKLSNV